ncbi:MAG: prepilin-type N-terminal cleavage/methylation domain-containing protein [Armatimonadetes bacterium]|nr:prepilin-type N-terminal cleavage/methylation domain-containing protein [Armatimonadota bacterium]
MKFGGSQRMRGFTLVEIMIVVLIIGILLSIAVPSFIQARQSGRRSSCLANMKEIESAKEQWAMDNRKSNGDTVAFTDLVGMTLYMKSTPSCAEGGTYSLNPIGTVPTCTVSGHVLP